MKKSSIIIVAIVILLGVLFFVTTCYRGGLSKTTLPPGYHQTTVKEVLQTNNYTYINVEEDDKTYWIAVVTLEAKPGDLLYYSKSMEMSNFKSRELDRTFATILFVDDATKTLPTEQPAKQPLKTTGKPTLARQPDISITVPAGGITIEELYKNPGNYSNKTVTIRGKILKYNEEIMNKNWIHIQDGTQFSEKYDLTITTTDKLQAGNEVTFTGKITLNKDFGSGYYYDVIMEDARSSDVK
jgi:starvation-inducible outer membrane lipoprotein